MASEVNLDECYEVAKKLARDAGEIISSAFGKKKNVKTKQTYADLVTETDKKVEEYLKCELKSQFPDHCFIGEETSDAIQFTDDPTWIVDPVDGTMNFVHGFPYTCVSIGLTVKKEVVLGVVFNPILEKMYSAVKEKGAFCNGNRIEVSAAKEMSQALILCEVGSSRDNDVLEQVHTNYINLTGRIHGIRMMGSAALNMCAVAAGEGDAYFEYTLHCWDMAAGKIIVEEAGGVVMDPEGGPLNLMSRRVLCASTPELAKSLSKALTHIQMPFE